MRRAIFFSEKNTVFFVCFAVVRLQLARQLAQQTTNPNTNAQKSRICRQKLLQPLSTTTRIPPWLKVIGSVVEVTVGAEGAGPTAALCATTMAFHCSCNAAANCWASAILFPGYFSG
jgi:hypothetical protein